MNIICNCIKVIYYAFMTWLIFAILFLLAQEDQMNLKDTRALCANYGFYIRKTTDAERVTGLYCLYSPIKHFQVFFKTSKELCNFVNYNDTFSFPYFNPDMGDNYYKEGQHERGKLQRNAARI